MTSDAHRPGPPPIRPPYLIKSDETWALVRAYYLRGESARSLSERFGVSVSNIRKKAGEQGWTRKAFAELTDTHGPASGAARDLSPQRAAAPPPPDWPPDRPAEWPPEDPPTWTGETWTSWKEAPPESLRQGPRPLPGMWRKPMPAWSPPPGTGPMPPHIVPPVPRPAEPDETLSPGEVAELATAAAGRAVMEGRYQEAERLGKLAETMRRLAGGTGGGSAAPKGKAARFTDDPDAEEDVGARLPNNERPLNCTMDTCAVYSFRERALEGIVALSDQAHIPLADDLIAWTDMAEAMRARIDPEVAETAAAFQATGMHNLHDRLGALLGPMPVRPRAPRREIFR